MNCQAFNQIIVEFVSVSLSDANTRTAAEAHVQSCAVCAARVAQQQTVAVALAALAEQEQIISAPVQLFTNLQRAFEQQHVQALVIPKPRQPWLEAWLNWRLVAATAVLLLVFGLGTLRLWRPAAPAPPVTNTTARTSTNEPQPAQAENSSKFSAEADNHVPPVRRPRRRTNPVRRSANEYGELLSLLPLAPTEADEFQQVVRLQIPRATLRLWGLPINEESTAEQVSAEVVFNEVGVARAIRLRNEK